MQVMQISMNDSDITVGAGKREEREKEKEKEPVSSTFNTRTEPSKPTSGTSIFKQDRADPEKKKLDNIFGKK